MDMQATVPGPIAMSATRTDVEVLISTHPLLESYISELKQDKVTLQSRLDSIEATLAATR